MLPKRSQFHRKVPPHPAPYWSKTGCGCIDLGPQGTFQGHVPPGQKPSIWELPVGTVRNARKRVFPWNGPQDAETAEKLENTQKHQKNSKTVFPGKQPMVAVARFMVAVARFMVESILQAFYKRSRSSLQKTLSLKFKKRVWEPRG